MGIIENIKIISKKFVALGALLFITFWLQACSPSRNVTDQSDKSAQQATAPQEPVIEASPLESGEGSWKIASSDELTFTVTAPGAQQAKILYKPVAATDSHLSLKTIESPTDSASGKFEARLKTVSDFAGDVWAEVYYPDGSKKETKPISIAARESFISEGSAPSDGSSKSVESARSDRLTGGKIEKASFEPGQPDIKITVDVPAFKLTFWQNGKEVKTYDVGIGRKEFPIVIGERKASQVIYNPDWIPPDSEWVSESENVKPGEHIEADDPRNPLGKLKIPLGDAYLIHEAAKPSDIGNLVSHGCIRMLKDDIFDLAEKITAARNLPVSKQEIERLKKSSERKVVKLDKPLLVDINYDTQVVEGGALHIYPDVYDRNTNAVDNLRSELQSVGVDVSKLDDQTLKQIMDRASKKEEFVVSVSDLQAGRALTTGKTQPLTSRSGQKQTAGDKKQPRSARSRR